MVDERLAEMRKNFPDSSFDWEYYLEEVDQSELHWKVKKRVLRGFKLLRDSFGEDWPKYAFKPPQRPLYSFFLNQADWSRLWVSGFVEKLRVFRKRKDFSKVLTRLKDKN